MKDLKKPIIIGGCGGSGTTLLRKMLDAHPNIACGPEMSVFDRPELYKIGTWELYSYWHKRSFDDLDKGCVYPIRLTNQADNTTESYFMHHRADYATDEEIEALFDAEPENPIQFFRWFFSHYAEKQGKKRWAEKTPNNIFCFKQILTTMPDAQLIEVVRDGRDVVYSLENKRGISPVAASVRWLMATWAGYQLRQKDIWLVRYENLVKQPEIELKSICAFLGEDYDPAMISSDDTEPFDDSVGQWKGEDVNPVFKDMINLALGERLKTLKYE